MLKSVFNYVFIALQRLLCQPRAAWLHACIRHSIVTAPALSQYLYLHLGGFLTCCCTTVWWGEAVCVCVSGGHVSNYAVIIIKVVIIQHFCDVLSGVSWLNPHTLTIYINLNGIITF